MKPYSRSSSNSSSKQRAVGRRQKAEGREPRLRPQGLLLLTAACLLLAGLSTGCESLQRKFTRKSKQAKAPPTPIISFQDYTRTMTPLDRYRKHYMLFDYWNDNLIRSLQDSSPNPKRFKLASQEALGELETLKGLLTDEPSARLDSLIQERTRLHQRLQRGSFSAAEASSVCRLLEAQTRQVQREFFWRDVQDHLKAQDAKAD